MIDHAARAAQLGRIYEHAGDRFTWVHGNVTVIASAIASPFTPDVTEADRDVREIGNAVLLAFPRAVFGAELPRKGQAFTDAAGRSYRIVRQHPLPPSSPSLQFICTAPLA